MGCKGGGRQRYWRGQGMGEFIDEDCRRILYMMQDMTGSQRRLIRVVVLSGLRLNDNPGK